MRVRVKPAPGLSVHFEPPREGLVPSRGAAVELTTYYSRRLRDGDLVRVGTPAKKTAAKKPEAKRPAEKRPGAKAPARK